MKTTPKLLVHLCIVSMSLGISAITCPAQSEGVLKGSVTETGRLNKGPALNRRQDIDKEADPFSGPEGLLEAPKENFKADPPKRAPKPPLKGNVQDAGNFQGTPQQPIFTPGNDMPIDGVPEEMPRAPMQQQQQFNPQDPDSSPDMQLQWDMWHKRVASVIFERFNFFAKAAFKHSPPLLADVAYVVTRDCHITNMNMRQKSSNVLFNVLVFQSVKSLDGDASVLTFPQGSRRMVVQKYGTFTQNYGQEGFRHTVGDYESIQGQRQQMQQNPQMQQQMMQQQMMQQQQQRMMSPQMMQMQQMMNQQMPQMMQQMGNPMR